MAKFSVLVAVYNAAATLPRCLDSLRAQTLTDFEAICIDDASTDGSWAILSRYAERDRRFIIRHLDENRGQAHARNIGLALATGQYTTFLDSDDAGRAAADSLGRDLDSLNIPYCTIVMPKFSEDCEVTSFTSESTATASSIGFVTSLSTSSGDAPA